MAFRHNPRYNQLNGSDETLVPGQTHYRLPRDATGNQHLNPNRWLRPHNLRPAIQNPNPYQNSPPHPNHTYGQQHLSSCRPTNGKHVYDIEPEIVRAQMYEECISVDHPNGSTRTERQTDFTKGHYSHMIHDPAIFDIDVFNTETLKHSQSSVLGKDDAHFTFRHAKYEPKLVIAITGYNEDANLFSRTLKGVSSNIADLTHQPDFISACQIHSKGAWLPYQKILVVILLDGILKANEGTLGALEKMGAIDFRLLHAFNEAPNLTAHIFETTTRLVVDTSRKGSILSMPNEKPNLPPMQMMVVIKKNNQQKINSHRWLFQAIGHKINPNYFILLDAGTRPGSMAIYKLWSSFNRNKHVGGNCGEITADLAGGLNLRNPLVCTQNFEYKMSNIIDKPLETVLGYISVLPGAFSAYRFEALRGQPLKQYFLGDESWIDFIENHDLGIGHKAMSTFEKNMYLAEDRILCFEIVFKTGQRWVLDYVKGADGETDVVERPAEFIQQRRRWLNGSLAASLYALKNFTFNFRIIHTNHNIFRKLLLTFQMIYNFIVFVFTLLALGNYWLSFIVIIGITEELGIRLFVSETATYWVNSILMAVYCLLVPLQVVVALGNRPKTSEWIYYVSFLIFGVCAYYMFVCAFWLTFVHFYTFKWESDETAARFIQIFSGTTGVLLLALLSTYGLYFIGSLLYLDLWHLGTSFPWYMAFAPSMTNIVQVYAFCNLQDVSWGTKGSVTVAAKKGSHAAPTMINPNQFRLTREQSHAALAQIKIKETREQRAVRKDKAREEAKKDESSKWRTWVVGFWILINALLIMSIQVFNGSDANIERETTKRAVFFQVILMSTAILSAIRLIGCIVYWLTHTIPSCCRRTKRAPRHAAHGHKIKHMKNSDNFPNQNQYPNPSQGYSHPTHGNHFKNGLTPHIKQ